MTVTGRRGHVTRERGEPMSMARTSDPVTGVGPAASPDPGPAAAPDPGAAASPDPSSAAPPDPGSAPSADLDSAASVAPDGPDATLPAGRLARLLAQLRSRRAIGWYLGAGIALIWLLSPLELFLHSDTTTLPSGLGLALLILFALVFLLSSPLQQAMPPARRLVFPALLLLISLCLAPWFGASVPSLWTYPGVSLGMAALKWRYTWPLIMTLGAVAYLIEGSASGWGDEALQMAAIIISISMMMAAFGQARQTMQKLRATQREVEQLAAGRERTRMSRDLHDILGHSLTVVTVKADLAGRLVDLDPERAKTELHEIQELTRGALADVRATVAGARRTSISAELAAARSALEDADIRADLPLTSDVVPVAYRDLAGWVVREGVTNVIRHAGACRCRVRLASDRIEIADDGRGPTDTTSGSSTGLTGLRERVESAGGRLSVGRSDLGGFRLTVTLP